MDANLVVYKQNFIYTQTSSAFSHVECDREHIPGEFYTSESYLQCWFMLLRLWPAATLVFVSV